MALLSEHPTHEHQILSSTGANILAEILMFCYAKYKKYSRNIQLIPSYKHVYELIYSTMHFTIHKELRGFNF